MRVTKRVKRRCVFSGWVYHFDVNGNPVRVVVYKHGAVLTDAKAYDDMVLTYQVTGGQARPVLKSGRPDVYVREDVKPSGSKYLEVWVDWLRD